MERPGLAPGRYFRLLLVGYFEGLDSGRAITWRAAGSPSVRGFLGLALDEAAPDYSTISRTRRRLDVETHEAVFTRHPVRTLPGKCMMSIMGSILSAAICDQYAFYPFRSLVAGGVASWRTWIRQSSSFERSSFMTISRWTANLWPLQKRSPSGPRDKLQQVVGMSSQASCRC